MSSPTTSSPTTSVGNTGTLTLDALLGGDKWGGAVGSGVTVTYSFPFSSGSAVFSGPGGSSYSDLNEPHASEHYGFNTVQQAAATAALQAWANVANIKPVLVADTTTSVGDIRFAWTSATQTASGGGGAWGWANYPDSFYPSGGDVWVSTDPGGALGNNDWSVGSYNYMSLIHELGHALGLKHPFEDGAVLDSAHANRLYSLMAYTDAPHSLFVDVTQTSNSASWKSYTVVPNSPMLYDIAVMQYLYGANTSYHTGNDTYTFDPSTPFLSTIWDAGGNDTISIANFSNGSVIDLQQGHYSSIHIPSNTGAGINWQTDPPVGTYDGTNNLAIAYGTVIENAIGGSGDDTLIGNSSSNRLQGNGGHNIIDGGAGTDTAVYTGAFGNYALAAVSGGYTVASRTDPGQSDSLSNIERLTFADGAMALNLTSVDDDPVQAQYVALAQKFYVAFFGRPADTGGLTNVIAQLKADNAPIATRDLVAAYYTNAPLQALVDNFGNSGESAALYHGTNQEFVSSIYVHLLGRAPDAGGNFWVNALNSGLPRGVAALDIMGGAESNTSAQGLLDGEVVNNRLLVASNFTTLLDTKAEQDSFVGEAAADTTRTLLDGVHENTSIIGYEAAVIQTVVSLLGSAHAAAGPQQAVLVGSNTAEHASAWA